MGFCVVNINGRLGGDVKTGVTDNGKTWANFSVAISQTKTNKPLWLQCVAWGGAAETLGDYGKKGRKIVVIGELKNRDYTDTSGVERSTMEVVVMKFEFQDSTNVQY